MNAEPFPAAELDVMWQLLHSRSPQELHYGWGVSSTERAEPDGSLGAAHSDMTGIPHSELHPEAEPFPSAQLDVIGGILQNRSPQESDFESGSQVASDATHSVAGGHEGSELPEPVSGQGGDLDAICSEYAAEQELPEAHAGADEHDLAAPVQLESSNEDILTLLEKSNTAGAEGEKADQDSDLTPDSIGSAVAESPGDEEEAAAAEAEEDEQEAAGKKGVDDAEDAQNETQEPEEDGDGERPEETHNETQEPEEDGDGDRPEETHNETQKPEEDGDGERPEETHNETQEPEEDGDGGTPEDDWEDERERS
jgi:hypothetical protein